MLKLPTLASLQNYQNPALIARYEKNHPHNKLSGEAALQELMKFFWLSHKHQIDLSENPENENLKFACQIHEEMSEIDDMWHTFLLFTHAYQDFCQTYFGQFVHHIPRQENAEPISEQNFLLDFERYLNYVAEQLDEATLSVWFDVEASQPA